MYFTLNKFFGHCFGTHYVGILKKNFVKMTDEWVFKDGADDIFWSFRW